MCIDNCHTMDGLHFKECVCDCVCAYSCVVAWLLEDIWCSHITHDQWPWTDDGLLSKWQDFWSFISFVVEINLSVTNRVHREKVWMESFPDKVHLLTAWLCWLLMGQPLQQQLLQLAPNLKSLHGFLVIACNLGKTCFLVLLVHPWEQLINLRAAGIW